MKDDFLWIKMNVQGDTRLEGLDECIWFCFYNVFLVLTDLAEPTQKSQICLLCYFGSMLCRYYCLF